MEREPESFHAFVRAAYRRLAREYDWVLIDGSGDVDSVELKVWEAVAKRLAP